MPLFVLNNPAWLQTPEGSISLVDVSCIYLEGPQRKGVTFMFSGGACRYISRTEENKDEYDDMIHTLEANKFLPTVPDKKIIDVTGN